MPQVFKKIIGDFFIVVFGIAMVYALMYIMAF